MMHEGLLDRAHARAQRRFRAMVDHHAFPIPSAPETRLYVQAERLVDALIDEAQWEQVKAEMDELIRADMEQDSHVADVYGWTDAEARFAYGDR